MQHGLFRHSSFVLIVSTNDALHQVVPHHVAFVEIHEGQTFYVFQNISSFEKTAAPRIGQINLRNVAGNDGFGIETQTGDKHFHLFRGRVLCLVQNYERII